MHKVTEWEASRSGAGITVAVTGAGNVRRKLFVKKIEAKGVTVTAIGADGARFDLTRDAGDTSAEVASIAGDLLDIRPVDFDAIDSDGAARLELATKIRKLAASALGQRS